MEAHNMPSKFDRLRSGETVEIEPGRTGRLNFENKTFTRSDGLQTYVGDDPDFFPPDEEGLKFSKEKESLERDVKKAPLGEFLYQFGNQGVAGAVKNTYNKLTKSGDDYLRSLKVNQQVGERISEESPWTSGAATAASFVPDIALTKGMGGARAGATLAAAHAGPRIFEEPSQVAGEALISGIGGKLIEKGAQGLNRIASRRGEVRALPGQQQAVRNQNIAGQQAVTEANAKQTQAFNALKQNVKTGNELKLQQHQADLTARENQIIQDQNAYEQRKLQRDAEVIRLKNKAEMDKAQRNANAAQSDAEFKTAKEAADLENKRMTEKFKQDQAQYEAQLKQLPQLQKQAQAEHSAEVVKNASEIEKMFPKNSRIATEDLGVNEFIENGVNLTGLAGSREASQARRIITALFPEGELIGGRELSRRYKALEDSIQRASPEVQKVLSDFKQHLGQKLPAILEDSIAFSKISPLLTRSIDKDVKGIIDSMKIKGTNIEPQVKKLINTAIGNARSTLREELNPRNFVERIQNGELAKDIANKILTVDDFLFDINPADIPGLRKSGILQALQREAETKHSYFVDKLSKEIQNKLARYEIKALQSAKNTSGQFAKDIRKTYGLAEPVAPPSAPLPPNPVASPAAPTELPPVPPVTLPPPVQPAQLPPKFNRPALAPEPIAPPAQTFTPTPEPTLAPAQGMAERTGDFLEKPLLSGGKGLVNNPITKLGALKYLLGKAALPAEAAYLGMKGLTSPTAVGQVARMTFKQGGIEAITQWAQKYPSYHDGILENPQDRRSLTKEVEDAYDIPIEQKAVIQSKINRGKPLQERL